MKKFLELVEIQTKVASVFPYIVGNLLAYYRYQKWSLSHALILLVALLSIDMATTALNNYMDHKRAIKKVGYNYQEHNAIVKHDMGQGGIILTILMLLIVASGFGLVLVAMTDIYILLMGMVAFAIGLLYSYGPLPISRTPLGEVVSGMTMGFGIIFMSFYSQAYDQALIQVSLTDHIWTLAVKGPEIVFIFLYALPMTVGIANIMLANNICDMADDYENKRYTLPIYLGKDRALKLYRGLWYLAALSILVLVVGRQVSPIHVLTLTVYGPIHSMYGVFKSSPSKEKTFVTAVKSFVLMSLALCLSLLVHIVFML